VVSWSEAFTEDYDQWTADVRDDVPFYVELAREAVEPVVELAIGDEQRVAIIAWALFATTGR
jgi:hypothetical protein